MSPRVLAFVCVCSLAGCAEVKPWQRGYIARPEMQLGGSSIEAFRQHVYESKEAAGGGTSGVHGGCGCN